MTKKPPKPKDVGRTLLKHRSEDSDEPELEPAYFQSGV